MTERLSQPTQQPSPPRGSRPTKVVLFYVFAPLPDPEAIRLWQRDLCRSLGLRGRIIVSPHGINATVGGELSAVKKYLRTTREYGPFSALDVKWGEGSGLDPESADAWAPHGYSRDFPRLSVKVRDELVTFGNPAAVTVDDSGIVGGGDRLTPEQLHRLVEERGDDVVFVDGRNAFEAEIGRFRNAVVPSVDATRDFLEVLDSGELDDLKSRTVVTYCTGGIRCEILTAHMKERGFNDVYQLDGGILRYGERYGDEGLWEGSVYVFDQRGAVEFSDDATVIGRCRSCGAPSNRMRNCSDLACRTQLVLCPECAPTPHYCDEHTAA